MSSSNFITTEPGNRQNLFPKEVKPQIIKTFTGFYAEAEKENGRWAMIGFIALLGAYLISGQIIPGIF
tara:strand:- start:552 stop:755 length:204 start_codon:yes stop_codon:yes gene_type:complete